VVTETVPLLDNQYIARSIARKGLVLLIVLLAPRSLSVERDTPICPRCGKGLTPSSLG